MNSVYTKKLGFWIQKTDIGIQKINGSSLDTFRMVITSFQVQNKSKRLDFFKKSSW